MSQKNRTIEFEGVILHKGQKRIVKEILNSSAKYIVLNCSRQYGKSVLASQLILNHAINNYNTRCFYGTPIHAQAKKVYNKIYNAIKDSGIIKDNNGTDKTITLINNSVLIFSGTENYDNLRGESIDYMILDEFSFMKEEAFTTALKPMLLSRPKSKCILISTPRGKRNLFYKLSKLGEDEYQLNYSYHKGIYLENPYYDFEEIEDARKNLPSYIFNQEYLGEFIDNGQEIFSNTSEVFILDEFGKPDRNNYGGLDLGRQNDYTVLTILNKAGDLVFQYRDRQKDWETIINNVVMYLKKYNASCSVEVNSIGDVVYDLIKKKYQNIEAFQTTNKSKQEIIELLTVEFQNKTIKLLKESKDKTTYDELLSLEFEYNIKTRTISYGAPSGLHDDTVMSLALANYNRYNNKGFRSVVRG